MTEVLTIAVVPGDGIGPEVCQSAVQVLQAAVPTGVELQFTYHDGGAGTFMTAGTALPDETLEACRQADAVLHGAAGLPDVNYPDGTEAGQDFSMKMRSSLDLYANIRPIKHFEGIAPVLVANGVIDYVIVRENTEGLYAARSGGNVVRDEIASDTMLFTRRGIERICHKAAEVALARNGAPLDGKRRVTIVDKANVLRGYAFFRKVALSVLEQYPTIEVECVLIDAMTAYMVQQPERFDVIVTENIFGDIISDLGAATVGGLGIAPSSEVGENHGYFQGIHGSAPTIAGKGIANPVATILSGAEMLIWLAGRKKLPDLAAAGQSIIAAVETILAERTDTTADIGGTASTHQCTDAIIAKIRQHSQAA